MKKVPPQESFAYLASNDSDNFSINFPADDSPAELTDKDGEVVARAGEEPEDATVKAKIMDATLAMAKEQRAMLREVLLMGVTRLVVEKGVIRASVKFDFKATENIDRQDKAMVQDARSWSNSISHSGGFFGSIFGGPQGGTTDSGRHAQSSVATTKSEGDTSVTANLQGFVEITFKTDYFHLDNFATMYGPAAGAAPTQPGAGWSQRPGRARYRPFHPRLRRRQGRDDDRWHCRSSPGAASRTGARSSTPRSARTGSTRGASARGWPNMTASSVPASRTRTSPLLGPVEAGSRGRVLLPGALQPVHRGRPSPPAAVVPRPGPPRPWRSPTSSGSHPAGRGRTARGSRMGRRTPWPTLTLPADRWMRPYAASLPTGPRPLDAATQRGRGPAPLPRPVPRRPRRLHQPGAAVREAGAAGRGASAAGRPADRPGPGRWAAGRVHGWGRGWSAQGRPRSAALPAAGAGAESSSTGGRSRCPDRSGTGTGACPGAFSVPPAGQAAGNSLATSASTHYSYASIAPLLAALPALAPLLQSVLTPQTVQSLISAADPNKLLSTTIAGVMDAAKIGQQATDALHAHLRALNPGLGDDVLVPLLLAMSMAPEREYDRYTISRLVQVELPTWPRSSLGGYPQVAFRRGEDMTLPVSVVSPPRCRGRGCASVSRTRSPTAGWRNDRGATTGWRPVGCPARWCCRPRSPTVCGRGW